MLLARRLRRRHQRRHCRRLIRSNRSQSTIRYHLRYRKIWFAITNSKCITNLIASNRFIHSNIKWGIRISQRSTCRCSQQRRPRSIQMRISHIRIGNAVAAMVRRCHKGLAKWRFQRRTKWARSWSIEYSRIRMSNK